MGLRESVAYSLNSKDLEPSEFECAIDRVGALARASALGSALWRYGYAGDDSAIGSVIRHLLRKAERRTKIYKHHKDFELLKRTCFMVLNEWKYKFCLTCQGAKEISTDKLKVICQQCKGTGLHRFSDNERMNALKIEKEKYAAWQRNISEVWICLAGADAGAGATCRVQLEHHKIAA